MESWVDLCKDYPQNFRPIGLSVKPLTRYAFATLESAFLPSIPVLFFSPSLI